jgi:hypothetical protein
MSHIGYCTTKKELGMYDKSEFEKQMARADELMEAIVDATMEAEIAAARVRSAHSTLNKLSGGDELRKVANMLADANEKVLRVRGLQAKCQLALDRANAARERAAEENMLHQPMPVGRGPYQIRRGN